MRTQLFRVLKQVHPTNGCTAEAMAAMCAIMDALAAELGRLAHEMFDSKTVGSWHVQAATRLLLRPTPELSRHAVSEATKAITRFVAGDPAGVKRLKPPGRSFRAGLQLPVSVVERRLRDACSYFTRVTGGAPMYLAAVLEYLAAELWDLAGNRAADQRRVRITKDHLRTAIEEDWDLSQLLFRRLHLWPIVAPPGARQPGWRPEDIAALPDLPPVMFEQEDHRALGPVLGRGSFERAVRRMAHVHHTHDLRFGAGAVLAMQQLVEAALVQLMRGAAKLARAAQLPSTTRAEVQECARALQIPQPPRQALLELAGVQELTQKAGVQHFMDVSAWEECHRRACGLMEALLLDATQLLPRDAHTLTPDLVQRAWRFSSRWTGGPAS